VGGWIPIAGGSVDSGVLTPGSVSVVDGLSQLVGLSVGITTDDISVIYQSSTSSAYLLSLYSDGSLITTYSSTGVQYVSTASSGRIAFNHNDYDGVNIYADSSVAFGADGLSHGTTSPLWTNYNGIYFGPNFTAGDLGYTGFFDGWTPSVRVYARQDANWNVTSTVMLTLADPTGTTSNAVERYDYTPYGQVTLLDGAFETKAYSERDWRQGFQGGFADPVTGLVHFGAREYDPRQGRWKQQDPLGWPEGGNRYEAMGGNPVGRVDPSGMITGGGGSGNVATDLVYKFGTSRGAPSNDHSRHYSAHVGPSTVDLVNDWSHSDLRPGQMTPFQAGLAQAMEAAIQVMRFSQTKSLKSRQALEDAIANSNQIKQAAFAFAWLMRNNPRFANQPAEVLDAIEEAARHFYWICLMKAIYDSEVAEAVGIIHEAGAKYYQNTAADSYRDSANNSVALSADTSNLTMLQLMDFFVWLIENGYFYDKNTMDPSNPVQLVLE
jgi:RHS repeat-associated protein